MTIILALHMVPHPTIHNHCYIHVVDLYTLGTLRHRRRACRRGVILKLIALL